MDNPSPPVAIVEATACVHHYEPILKTSEGSSPKASAT